MNPRELGFLLLSSRLGDPNRRPLTTAQLRLLAQRMTREAPGSREAEVSMEYLQSLGLGRELCQRILNLMAEESAGKRYAARGAKSGCVPITRVSPDYPVLLRRKMGLDAPGCLWAKGDLSILNTPTISLVGSRDLNPASRSFAREAGRQAALQGYTLVSGNARGSDITAQESCLASGGRVISIVADSLASHPMRENVLWLSEDGFEEPFSAYRALHRNHVIHALGSIVLIAQCTIGKGGTWDGTIHNLHSHLTPVFCFDNGTDAVMELYHHGAGVIAMDSLQNLSALQTDQETLPGFE